MRTLPCRQLIRRPFPDSSAHHCGEVDDAFDNAVTGNINEIEVKTMVQKGRVRVAVNGYGVIGKRVPHEVIYRSPSPLLTPETPQERQGAVANVVFPTGIDRRDDLDPPNRFNVYYGMSDSRISVARFDLPGFLPPIDGRPASVGASAPAANNSCSEKNS